METAFETSVRINAPLSLTWKHLTTPGLMKEWMGEPGMNLEIDTGWVTGCPFTIRGFHNTAFENRGSVLAFEPEKLLRYSHLSSVSDLPDSPHNFSIIEFRLEPVQNATILYLAVSNFPNEIIYKHLCLYWKATIGVLKKYIEQSKEMINEDQIADHE
jgi:uncharacterized protein YndB with AHSA1/START domain